jgi:hypothetical protein
LLNTGRGELNVLNKTERFLALAGALTLTTQRFQRFATFLGFFLWKTLHLIANVASGFGGRVNWDRY